jgi:hypothetical protein
LARDTARGRLTYNTSSTTFTTELHASLDQIHWLYDASGAHTGQATECELLEFRALGHDATTANTKEFKRKSTRQCTAYHSGCLESSRCTSNSGGSGEEGALRWEIEWRMRERLQQPSTSFVCSSFTHQHILHCTTRLRNEYSIYVGSNSQGSDYHRASTIRCACS